MSDLVKCGCCEFMGFFDYILLAYEKLMKHSKDPFKATIEIAVCVYRQLKKSKTSINVKVKNKDKHEKGRRRGTKYGSRAHQIPN